MKTRALISVLLVFACFFQLEASMLEIDPHTEKTYWRFIKDRLFDGQNDIASKFQKNIYIQLTTDCSDDSVIVNDLIKVLQKLIPDRKIEFLRSTYENPEINIAEEVIFLGINKAPMFSNRDFRSSKNINGNQIFYTGFKGIYQPEIYMQGIHIKLSDSVTFAERKRYIEFAVLRSLCTIKGRPKEASTFFPNAVFNGFDYEPYGTEFSEVDKFLIQKLYSKDFDEKFKRYLIDNYSRRYYRAFLYKDQYNSIKTLISLIITLLVIALFYKTLLFRNYKYKYIGYINIALILGATFVIIHWILQHIASIGVYRLSTNIIISLAFLIVSVLLATILYGAEFLFIRPYSSFNTKTFLKVIFFFIIISIPSFILRFTIPGFSTAMLINFITFGFVVALGRGFLLYIKEVGDSTIRQKDVELLKLEDLKVKAEMQSLNAKINPHFLYNSLNSIAGLAHINPDKTEKMAVALSDLFKYNIDRTSKQYSTIREEVEMASAYLEIEEIRFTDRLNYSIHIDAVTESIEIPRNLILPLVENAVKHGISKIEGVGEIYLSVKKSDGGFLISVKDNGPDFPDGLVSGFGLKCVQDIIQLYYKGKAEFSWQNEPQKMVTIEVNSTI
ncbi:sensor histidine kinase [Natronoflexus pectinivorans]|uniref:Histidine kinase n=1 Tax=Natronoflexus pectinivorans TaxID=682526 RepID=A0A4R2GHZ5_9BACT|nr:histidine kinase [Natronoflexus pectinivorans]TCO07893.1 histidine kinase [Natronoflexus pectinivorans]